MKSITSIVALFVGLVAVAPLSVHAGSTVRSHELEAQAQKTVHAFEKNDPSLAALFRNSHGYVVFPKIGKGGAIIGGARGKGLVYEKGAVIGEASLTQVTVGLVLGGETFSQVIFFENQKALARFKENRLEFAAQATATAVNAGSGAQHQFDNGMAVYTMARKGAMGEAAIGGQKFHYTPNAS
ncbi:MAG: YSC84-related protein [Acidiferrobacterales bacterium]